MPAAGLFAWKETVEINTGDAHALGVREGDAVWIETPAGRARLHVRVHDGTPAGSLGLPLGHGPWPPTAEQTATAGGHGLLVALADPLAGTQAQTGTRARVRKEA
jgi:anaerobic selenocysteine-containing dehydrogenase